MARLFLVCVWALAMLGPAAADGPWAGNWQVTWPNGGATLELQQNGEDVSGAYRNGRGRIEAKAAGTQLAGRVIHDGAREDFTAALNPDLTGFSGETSAGEWLSGLRMEVEDAAGWQPAIDLHSPRAALRTFLDAGNRARAGDPQALAVATDAIDFGSGADWAAQDSKFTAAGQLFELIDLATFPLSIVPEESAAPAVSLALPRADQHSTIDVSLQRQPDGKWLLVMPPPARLRATLAGLEGSPKPADNFRQLQSPRDTLRTFLDGMANWTEGGANQAIATLDLSGIPEVLKKEQGLAVAQYLVRIIDRSGHMILQSVPNSGASREPFVYLENPKGRIVIEPVGNGADTRWLFSPETVRDARRLFGAVDSLPEAHALEPRLIPPSPLFAIRSMVKTYAPFLLKDAGSNGRVEYWQIAGALLILAFLALVVLIVSGILGAGLQRPKISRHIEHPRRLALAISLACAAVISAQLIPNLGLPAVTRQYVVPIVGSGLVLIVLYAAWQVLNVISGILQDYAERSQTTIDNILLTFSTGLTRFGLVVVGGLMMGHLWSLPTTGILAGLGIGGLALAFASKETLANIFGAGILLGDRPFRKGDRIIADDVNGWVETVGLRSTRIRTIYDSLLIVPNSKLADTSINNLGARRQRSLSTTILVTSGGTPEKLQAFTRAILARISSDPKFDKHPEVNINGVTANGIQIEIWASIKTQRGWEARAITHSMFLDILQFAEAEGLTLGRGTEKNPVYYLQEG